MSFNGVSTLRIDHKAGGCRCEWSLGGMADPVDCFSVSGGVYLAHRPSFMPDNQIAR